VQFDLQNLAEIPQLVKRLGDIVNLLAPVALIQAVAPQMRRRRAGRIVDVGSVAAFTGHPDLWYGASKAALLNVTKSYATYLLPALGRRE
jgi:3-oxoacyl-[acyl-carrier protein] reductase